MITMTNEGMSAEEYKARSERSAKLILWFAMISMTMMFAGLTSAFVVSKSRKDWLQNFDMPTAFYASTVAILLCSVFMFMAKRSIKQDNRQATTVFLLGTLLLGGAFVALQFYGFGQIIQQGYYFTGPASNVTTTFLYIVAITHLAHLGGGIISLLVIIYKHFKQKYNASQTLGIELGATYWHFLDFLWLYLFLFLTFFK
ncbi:cytochrome c oxidase subunit 3 [Flavobacterium sp.]|uniref:cytochrome c oxidase subunit 3 n=1 Tax=Flavobacterium sp. TaxID=239 RepID=UPI0025BB4DD0|nr:cytochrome c oxidase subunit 3 [Flavobacterium sp.]